MDILNLIIGAAGVTVGGYALIKLSQLNQRLQSALGTSTGDSLEKTLSAHHKDMSDVSRRLEVLDDKYTQLTIAASVASQKISILRFNPFGDTGGDQSFSLAVLDSHDSGYVLTSIHGRQGTRVYVKPIDFGNSKYSLSQEEQQVISQAIKRVPQLPPNAKDAKR